MNTQRGTIIETLESRRLLAGINLADGVLRIEGSPLADNVVFERMPGGKLDVRIDNAEGSLVKLEPFNLADITRIEVDAGGGDDTVIVGQLRIPTLLIGGDGNDTLSGGTAGDTLSGGRGDDFLSGSLGADTLLGNDGDDELWPGTGSNIVGGGRGNDQLVRDGGTHRGPGPGGVDRSAELVTDTRGNPSDPATYRPRINLAGASPQIYLTTQNNRRAAVVDFYLSDTGYQLEWNITGIRNATLFIEVQAFDPEGVGAGQALTHYNQRFDLGPVGNKAYQRIVVSTPDDGVVVSRNVVRGDDTIPLGLGISPIFPRLAGEVRDGVAIVTGTRYDDRITARVVGDELVVSEPFAGEVRFDLGDVTGLRIYGGAGDDYINTPIALPVTLVGEAGDDTLGGGSADDNLEGGLGNDLLSGVDGDDVLDGGAGDDELHAGTGINELIGGAGFDWFRNGDSRGWDRTAGVEERRNRPGHPNERRTPWADQGLFEIAIVEFGEPLLSLYRNVITNNGEGFQATFFLNVPRQFGYIVTERRVGATLFIDVGRPRAGGSNNVVDVVILEGDDLPGNVVLYDTWSDKELDRVTFDPSAIEDEPVFSGNRNE